VDKEREIFTAQAQESGKPAEIIEKMVTGRLRKFLGEEKPRDDMAVIRADKMLLDHYTKKDRVEPSVLEVDQRLSGLDTEVNLGYSREQTLEESQRCMSCGYCFDCEKCWMYCQDQAIEKPMDKGALYTFKMQNCTGCSKCAEVCPCGFIEMH